MGISSDDFSDYELIEILLQMLGAIDFLVENGYAEYDKNWELILTKKGMNWIINKSLKDSGRFDMRVK